MLAGLVLAGTLLAMPPPDGLTLTGWRVAALGVLMAIWWMTEALPLAVTALVPLVFLPLVGAGTLDQVASAYADPLIFLFLGGFLMAIALRRWRLDKRLALYILRFGGTSPTGLIASLMVATAFLSMLVSNTAAAILMLPIGQSILSGVQEYEAGRDAEGVVKFSAALMLGIAYAATIGGMGTIIGTPPNALFAGYMREAHGVEIGFAQWMLVGMPAVMILLPVCWLILTKLVFRFSLPHFGTRLEAMAPISRGEVMTAGVIALAALGWLTRPLLQAFVPDLPLSDAGIAMSAAVLLFVLPVDWSKFEFLLIWKDTGKLPWGVLILFGGGLALAQAIGTSGLALWIGGAVQDLSALPLTALVLFMAVMIVAVGELASNTAMAAIFLPIAGAAAIGFGADPILLAMPVALAASLGFMLPVATPPNAIIFGSRAVTMKQMLKAGALLDIVSIPITVAIAMTIGLWVFGIGG